MFAVLAGDRTDAEALVELIKKISGQPNATVLRKGFKGCGNLNGKAWSQIISFAKRGATWFIICHDSDGKPPGKVRENFYPGIGGKKKFKHVHRIVVPVQELEAWIIADEVAINAAIPWLEIEPVNQPEQLENPKEWLVRKSRVISSRRRYIPAFHNAQVAKHLDIDKVMKKCNSFRELVDFVRDPK